MSHESKAQSVEAAGRNLHLAQAGANVSVVGKAAEPTLEDAQLVMSLLEADQVVAAKAQTHFGRRKFSAGVRALLWGLRIYVILMLIIVLLSVYHALQASH